MNTILMMNGVLLIALMGFQQWFDCYWKAQGDGHFNAQGVYVLTDFQVLAINIGSFFKHLCPLAPTTENYFYFLIISLAIPLLVGLNAKSMRVGKRELISLIVINPLLYCAVGFICQPSFGEHSWSWGQVAGPTIIGKQAAKPPLVILPLAVIVQTSALVQEKLTIRKDRGCLLNLGLHYLVVTVRNQKDPAVVQPGGYAVGLASVVVKIVTTLRVQSKARV